MTTRKRRRMWVLLLCAIGLGSATALTLTAFEENLVFFRSPSDILAERPGPDRAFRLGGLVEAGSVKREADGVTVAFKVTDTAKVVPVTYKGILPDLFQEGKGVVARGRLGPDGIFRADQVLARHDENYMPPEAAYALDQAKKSQGSVVAPAGGYSK